MQRLTVPERLLVVALLPALALLAREFFGPSNHTASFWPVFSVAIALTSIGLAILVARSLAVPIRQATDALQPLSGVAENAADQPKPRSEIAHLRAVIDGIVAAAASRKRTEAEHERLDRAEQGARRANLSNMATEVEETTERGLRTVVDGSAVLRAKTDDMRGALEAVHAASMIPPRPRTIRAP